MESQNKLWENNIHIWEELKSLRMSQEKLWEEVKILREEQNKLLENYEKMRKYMLTGFRELRTTLGVTFEEYSAGFLEMMLMEMGYPEARVEKKVSCL
jgi:arginyl-tRNA synthetase